MGIGYGWEKAMVAVHGMAASPESIQDRIASAYVGSLIRINPEHHLPPDLRPVFAEIRTALTSTPALGNEGSVIASAQAMTRDEATDIARKIVHLYSELCVATSRE